MAFPTCAALEIKESRFSVKACNDQMEPQPLSFLQDTTLFETHHIQGHAILQVPIVAKEGPHRKLENTFLNLPFCGYLKLAKFALPVIHDYT